MALRTPHGNAAKGDTIAPRLETLPVDELPAGVPAEPDPAAELERTPQGRFRPGNRTSRKGGNARAHHRRIAAQLGALDLPAGSPLRAYRQWAVEWRDATAADMARSIGGGIVGPMPASILDSAALALLWARHLSDQAMVTGDPDLAQRAAKMAESSSRLVREAWEYVAREARAREDDDDGGLAARQAEFQRRLAAGS